MKIVFLSAFKKEFKSFPIIAKESLLELIDLYIKGERLNTNEFKTFKLTREIKIQEFKYKDYSGNWRIISFIKKKDSLIFVHAFHKKSQALQDKTKNTILARIKKV